MQIAIFWHRRDLRTHDNAGLYHALKSGFPVLPIFIFDQEILDELEDKHDRRVTFIHHQLQQIQEQLEDLGSSLEVHYGKPIEVWGKLLEAHDIAAVYANHDYEPYAKKRDEQVKTLLQQNGIDLHTYKDQCIFEKEEVVKDDGSPYVVFSPYGRKWRQKLDIENSDFYVRSYLTGEYFDNFLQTTPKHIPSLEQMGFEAGAKDFPTTKVSTGLLEAYGAQRDLPAVKGTSKLSVHLRFGTISIREMARKGLAHSDKWLNELIWRDFYMMILHHFPHVVESAFRPEYEYIEWRNNEEEFKAWCEGSTGYPIVDAGMRELNTTGFMHNRVRMVVASFLTKHLLIDWRWGEAYFAEKLLDFELSSNNGGWQWAAGSGCDAAPYFRVFNPYSQTKKFDKDLQYIRKWVPEFQGFGYPKPIVEHSFARQRALDTYKAGLEKGRGA